MSWQRLLPSTAAWNGVLYGRLRLIVGVYLAVHFLHLAPWAAEVFSSRGLLPDARLSPLATLFPNLLLLADGPVFVTAFVASAGAAALLFAAGAADRACALYMFYALACLHGRNPLIANPSLPYVGWLLLAHVALPPLPMGVGLWRSASPDWSFSRPLQTAAWFLLAAGYSFSGYTKLVSPSWLDGTAMVRVLESPLARPGFLRETLLALPPALVRPMSYGALGLELLFLPLALIPRVRAWLWLALLVMHLSLMALIDFADLSFGMVVFHLFVADPAWAARWSRARAPRVAAVAFVVLAGAAVVPAPAQARQRDAAAPARERQLAWSADGAAIVVDDHWLVDPGSGDTTTLGCETALAGVRSCPRGKLVTARDGHLALLAEDRLWLGMPSRALGPSLPVPRWIGRSRDREGPVNVAYWLSPGRLFVQQFSRDGAVAPACRTFDVAAGRWGRPPGGCLSAGFSHLGHIDAGRDGWVALHSSAEGVFALELVRHELLRGQDLEPAASFELDAGIAGVRFTRAPDGPSAQILTPCALEGKKPPPCDEPDRRPAWRLYTVGLRGGSVRLLRADVPPRAALHPKDDRLVWQEGETACVGPLAPPRTARRCFPLPR